ncbi:NADH:flavin oxidoreductase [Gymnopus androsaceus JB14]|uniref:NADH:flavin oxidoreductase n=1 Tax=Gymnopus androsaceus JB14 TaxID=1447944 RepID=A0A6A4HS92_9AGAR|nr:NADH:flavin oxidoreductase [Gymnopus androsaceus JB14]
MKHINEAVSGVSGYFPKNNPEIGTPFNLKEDASVPLLFTPITIGNVTFKNRIFAAPMCQYSSDNGHATDWHVVHIGSMAVRGIGAICMEATAVVPEGRISPEDAGIWTDSQMEPLKRIVNFAHAHGTKIGVQLAHAGRKASTYATWVQVHGHHHTASKEENGWPDEVFGPSSIAWSENFGEPKELTKDELVKIEDAFLASIRRCQEIGCTLTSSNFIGAHGYLLHSFVSPLSNTRSDEFGGQSLENRLRWPLQLIARPEQENGQWKQFGIEQSKIYAAEMHKLGVDLVHVSTGGNWSGQKVATGPGFQVPFAEEIKKSNPKLFVGTVGLITDAKIAESYLQEGKADVIFLARALLRNPHWPLEAAEQLGVRVKAANQYERTFYRM